MGGREGEVDVLWILGNKGSLLFEDFILDDVDIVVYGSGEVFVKVDLIVSRGGVDFLFFNKDWKIEVLLFW